MPGSGGGQVSGVQVRAREARFIIMRASSSGFFLGGERAGGEKQATKWPIVRTTNGVHRGHSIGKPLHCSFSVNKAPERTCAASTSVTRLVEAATILIVSRTLLASRFNAMYNSPDLELKSKPR